MSDAKKLSDLAAAWLEAPKLDASEHYDTEILIISAPGDFMSRSLEGIADWADHSLNCLMRTTTHSGLTLHGPFPIPLTTLQNWGALPKRNSDSDGSTLAPPLYPRGDGGGDVAGVVPAAARAIKQLADQAVEIERLKAENAQLRDKWLRAVADLEKYKQE